MALWLTQIALAAMFVFAGGLKLTGAPDMVGLFDAIGIGQWFRYVTGSIEVVSAVALLVPAWAAFGALLSSQKLLAGDEQSSKVTRRVCVLDSNIEVPPLGMFANKLLLKDFSLFQLMPIDGSPASVPNPSGAT